MSDTNTAVSDPVPAIPGESAPVVSVPAPESTGAAPEAPKEYGSTSILMRLKQEAEDEVTRLQTELKAVRDQLLAFDLIEDQAKAEVANKIDDYRYQNAAKLREGLPSPSQWADLKATKTQLEAKLAKAEKRLDTELETIRKVATAAATSAAGDPAPRAKGDVPELLEAAVRVLPEYADKLDRLVESALTIWARRETKSENRAQPVQVLINQNMDSVNKTALRQLGYELNGLRKPLEQWFNRLSAALQEGRLTNVQKMELRLRLTELEMKFQTAQVVLTQLGVYSPTT